jgi:hypothetical protein
MSPIENQIRIDSFMHYRVRTSPGAPDFVEVHEFPAECPGMNDRGPFVEEEAVLLARYPKDTPVVFITVVGRCILGDLSHEMALHVTPPTGAEGGSIKIEMMCGDDFCGEIRRLDNVGASVT